MLGNKNPAAGHQQYPTALQSPKSHDNTPSIFLFQIIYQSSSIPRPSTLITTLQINDQNTSISRIYMRRQVISFISLSHETKEEERPTFASDLERQV
jgi:hypothetical protein